jgi:hypothetical protein
VPGRNVTITFYGGIEAPPSQIWDLSATGSLLQFATVGGFGQSLIPHCYPEWWGVNGNNAPYDTAAVQAAINSGITVLFARTYYVDTILIQTPTNPSTMIYGNGHALVGVATTGRAAVVQFNGSFCTLIDLWVFGNYNNHYSCGFQFLTTNAQNGPLYNLIVRLRITSCVGALVLGTPPSGTGAGEPIAGTPGDAFTDLFIENCNWGIYCNQKNAKFTFLQPRILILNDGSWDTQAPGVFSYASVRDSTRWRGNFHHRGRTIQRGSWHGFGRLWSRYHH